MKIITRFGITRKELADIMTEALAEIIQRETGNPTAPGDIQIRGIDCSDNTLYHNGWDFSDDVAGYERGVNLLHDEPSTINVEVRVAPPIQPAAAKKARASRNGRRRR